MEDLKIRRLKDSPKFHFPFYKRYSKQIILTFLSVLVSYIILKVEIQSFDKIVDDFIVSFLSTIFNYILKLTLIIISIYSLIQIKRTKDKKYLIPIIISTIVLILSLILWRKFEERESSKIVLKSYYDGDFNGLGLILRENKTYKIEDYSFLGGTYFFGNYKLKGDTIILSEKYPLEDRSRKIMGNKLLIKNGFILLKTDSKGIFNERESIQLKINYSKV